MRLHLILRKITETLAGELAAPTRCAPDWSDHEWVVARSVAAMHGISPLLSRTLRWQGPPGWVQFLDEQRAHTKTRHSQIVALQESIDRRARAAGIAVIVLKGPALHAMDLYAAGDRPMADIDLLVRPTQTAGAARLLESLGYHESSTLWKERVFAPIAARAPLALGEHANNHIKIDLHDRICERLPWSITDISEFIFPSQAHPGVNAYPSKASLMIHLLLHAAGSMTTRTLRLLQLHDLARLSARMSAADWDEVLARRELGAALWWASPPLQVMSRYCASRVPARVLAALADECPYVLAKVTANRSLYELSYSYPWVVAFPGLEWSRSMGELLGYTASRVWPSAAHIELRKQAITTEAWASQDPWCHLSQSRRILRWITSRPTRVPTMHAVRTALAQTH
jgi:hypothetical protein